MHAFLLPISLAFLVITAWFIVRGRGMAWRAASDAASLGLLTLPFLYTHASPFFPSTDSLPGPEDACLRLIAIMWWVSAARLSAVATRALLEHELLSREARLTADLASGTLYLATLLVVADFVFKLPIGGLVATSGVVAVVLGLALQNTLADVFSGIAVGLERPFGTGDRITMPNGIEGVVVEMNWRSIHIQTDNKDIATLPNSVVAKAQVINRSTPHKRHFGQITLSCPTTAGPEIVLEILRRSAMLCSEILEQPAPRATMIRLGVRTSSYTLDFFIPEAVTVADSKTALLSHVHRQLRFTGLLQDGRDAPRASIPTVDTIVSDTPLFASLSGERKAAVAVLMRRTTLRAGELLFAKDSEADGFHVVAAGIVEMTGTAPDVPSAALRRVGPGDTLGDVGLIVGEKRLYTARALTPCVIFNLPRKPLMQMIENDEGLARAIEDSASEHLAIIESAAGSGPVAATHGPHLLDIVRRLLWNRAVSSTAEVG